MNKIFYGKQFVDLSDINYVKKSLKSDLITTGDYVKKYENLVKKKLGSNFAISCNSGTSGLYLAFKALELKKNDNIIMPAINFVASYSMAKKLGANIFLSDVDDVTGMITPEKLIHCIQLNKLKKIKAVVLMYMGGFVENIDKFNRLKKKYNFKIVEDACHAFGSSYKFNNKYYQVGSCKHADLSVFSTHPLKTYTTGEGGIVSTNIKKYYNKMLLLRSHGIIKKKNYWNYNISELGDNFRLSDINCSLGISQLKKIKKFIKKRKKIFFEYYKHLKSYKNIVKLNKPTEENFSSYHLCIININFNKIKLSKEKFIKHLIKKGIYCQYHYIPIYNFSFYKKKINKYHFLGSESYFKNSISIPIFFELKKSELRYVIKTIKETITKNII